MVFGDAVAGFGEFLGDFVDGEARQTVELQFENRLGLLRGEGLVGVDLRSAARDVDINLLAREVSDQVVARVGAVGAGADDGDHVVEVIERGQVAFEDVLAVLRFVQQVRGAAADDIGAVMQEVLQRLNQAHFLGLVVGHGQENHAVALLHRRVLEELVQDDLRFRVSFQFDNDAHAGAITLVADIGNVIDDLVVHQRGNALDQAGLVHLVRNFGDDDGLLLLGHVLDQGLGAHHEAATTRAVSLGNAAASVDDAVGRKIRAFDDLQDLHERGGGIVHQQDRRIDDLGEIVRRNFSRHADGDSVGTIDEQIWNTRRKNIRLDFVAVVVRTEVDSFFVQIFE